MMTTPLNNKLFAHCACITDLQFNAMSDPPPPLAKLVSQR
jgi:hypothetical protein